MPIIISIIICTYNRADILPICLQSLADQTLDKHLFEVIIINNNSTDNTQEIAETFSKNQPNFRVVLESKQGLSHARNRGCFEAIGEYVAYSDDDCKIPKEWLAIARSIIDEQRPDIFGGPYYAFYNSVKPEWYKDEYGSHVQGSEKRALSTQEFLDGGNFFISRILLTTIGGFNPRLGMIGNEFGYGEETELQLKIRSQYPDIQLMYYPQLYVYHLVRKEKMMLKSIIFQRFQNGRDTIQIFKLREKTNFQIFKKVSSSMIHFLILLFIFPYRHIFRDKTCYPFLQNYFYEEGTSIFSSLGFLYEIVVVTLFSDAETKT